MKLAPQNGLAYWGANVAPGMFSVLHAGRISPAKVSPRMPGSSGLTTQSATFSKQLASRDPKPQAPGLPPPAPRLLQHPLLAQSSLPVLGALDGPVPLLVRWLLRSQSCPCTWPAPRLVEGRLIGVNGTCDE